MIGSNKVVTANEMARLENLAVAQGADPGSFMQEAGQKIALLAQKILEKTGGKKVRLLIGKGNNGGDAYAAGIQLLKLGFEVSACPLFPKEQCSPLQRQFAAQFFGEVDENFSFFEADLLIDGLLGTGFKGQVNGRLRQVIESANTSKKLILAIDIPSGLDGTTGEVRGAAICATHTATLGLAKTGLFLSEGWNYAGTVSVEEFGLPPAVIDNAQADFLLPIQASLLLPPMKRTHHKYERGFTVGFGGCAQFKGALKLSGRAAIHSGAGIVKLFSSADIGDVDDELISQLWNREDWHAALEKAQSVFVGPGLGRSETAKKMCQAVIASIEQPCVIDADALFFLPSCPAWPPHCVLTPHCGEMLQLLQEIGLSQTELFRRCSKLVEEKGCILVLKGAPTFVFSPGNLPFVLTRGNPGLATAGSGDVLTGIIAALLAQGSTLLEAALIGVTLHGLAGESAASDKTSYGYSASNLIDYLPNAFSSLLPY